MKFASKLMATFLALGLIAGTLACIPVLAESLIYGGDGVGYLAPKSGQPANEALRTGIYGGDQVGDLTPAKEEQMCNMDPKTSISCYNGMHCGPKSQQCFVRNKSQCTS